MEFNLFSHAEDIEEVKNRKENPTHLWLYGFHRIGEHKILDSIKVENYLSDEIIRFPKFSKLKNFSSDITKLFLLGENIINCYLPLNDNYHLEFPMNEKNKRNKLIYTKCNLCNGLGEHGFPQINLRESINFGNIHEKAAMADNRISIMNLNFREIVRGYSAFSDFIRYSSIF
ncbi:MAG: hypothetical protein Q7S27_05200 [Nanoarchaeota archaeon]|nr:hypothetical protein [Nanoarchaeota archaeon]